LKSEIPIEIFGIRDINTQLVSNQISTNLRNKLKCYDKYFAQQILFSHQYMLYF